MQRSPVGLKADPQKCDPVGLKADPQKCAPVGLKADPQKADPQKSDPQEGRCAGEVRRTQIAANAAHIGHWLTR